MRFSPSAAAISFFALALSSCADRALDRTVVPPPTPVLSRPLGWAVVDAAYSQVLDVPASSGVVLGYYRKGEVVPVVERKRERTEGGPISWLRNEGAEPGWLRESEVLLFDSPERARTASKAAKR